MKNIAFIVFSFFSGIPFTLQAQETAGMIVNFKDCRPNGEFHHPRNIPLYYEGKHFRFVDFNPGTLRLNDLKPGTYRFEYPNMFGIQMSKTVELEAGKRAIITLCADAFDYTESKFVPVIDRLNDNEEYTINFQSFGCFHSDEQTMYITRKGNTFNLKYNSENRTLTKEEVESIRHFEIELQYAQSGLCTTSDRYKVVYKDLIIDKIDGKCNWRGFQHLLKQLDLSLRP